MRRKLVIPLLLMLCMFLNVPISAYEETTTRNGSITIELTDTTSNYSKENVEFGIVKIADVIGGEYHLLDEYQIDDIDLNEIETAEELDHAAKQIRKAVDRPDRVVYSNEQGIAGIYEIPVGVYLVYAENVNNYEMIMPSIVSIPSFDEADKVMKYDVTLLPKHENYPIFRIIKADEKTGQPILDKPFEFSRYLDEGCSYLVGSVSGNTKNGFAEFRIRYGTWYFKETKAPQGYQLSEEVVKVELNEDGLYINDILMDKEDDFYSINYDNEQIPKTPNTGDNSNVIKMLGLLCVSGVALVVLIALKKNKCN